MDKIQLAVLCTDWTAHNARNFILCCCLFKEVFQTVNQENRAQSRNSRRRKISLWVGKATGIYGQNSSKGKDTEKEHPKPKIWTKAHLGCWANFKTSHTLNTSLEGVAQKTAEWLKTEVSQSGEEMLKFQLRVEKAFWTQLAFR